MRYDLRGNEVALQEKANEGDQAFQALGGRADTGRRDVTLQALPPPDSPMRFLSYRPQDRSRWETGFTSRTEIETAQ